MHEDLYMDIKIFKDTRFNLIEDLMENVIENILYETVKNKDGDVRVLSKGDTNEFYNANPEENGVKRQHLEIETYSIPVSKCYSSTLYSLLNSIINITITNCSRGYIKKPIVVFDGCRVNNANMEFKIGVGLQEE